ncbi:E3 ubiquitin-protein ligase [Sesbania bispinosa]|nr:E3 ubiquitin-protein ligase [Sesbania bispinosa]
MEDLPIGTQEAEQEHNNNETEGSIGSNANLGNSNDRGRSISAIITDPDVLDCFICFEPLSVPVYQGAVNDWCRKLEKFC